MIKTHPHPQSFPTLTHVSNLPDFSLVLNTLIIFQVLLVGCIILSNDGYFPSRPSVLLFLSRKQHSLCHVSTDQTQHSDSVRTLQGMPCDLGVSLTLPPCRDFCPDFPLFSFRGGLHRFDKLGAPTYPLIIHIRLIAPRAGIKLSPNTSVPVLCFSELFPSKRRPSKKSCRKNRRT